MTITEISAQKQQIEQKHARNMKKMKISCILELVAAVIISIIDMNTSTAKNPMASGFVIFLVLAAIVSAWNLILFHIFKKEKEREMAKLDASERRLIAHQKYAEAQREERAKVQAAQDALISLAKSKEQELNKHPTNCPNCGALLSSKVCAYCGTHI